MRLALSLSVVVTVTAALLQFTPAIGASGIGAPFGARDPLECQDRHAPTSGPISVAQARHYVQCEYEHYESQDDALWLVDVRSIEMGQPRPFNLREDSGGEFDVKGQLFPLRGGIVKYLCHKPGYAYAVGQSCRIWEVSDATGKCGRTNFHDWKCTLDGSAGGRNGPPPK